MNLPNKLDMSGVYLSLWSHHYLPDITLNIRACKTESNTQHLQIWAYSSRIHSRRYSHVCGIDSWIADEDNYNLACHQISEIDRNSNMWQIQLKWKIKSYYIAGGTNHNQTSKLKFSGCGYQDGAACYQIPTANCSISTVWRRIRHSRKPQQNMKDKANSEICPGL